MPINNQDEATITFDQLMRFIARLSVIGPERQDLDRLINLIRESNIDEDPATRMFLDAADRYISTRKDEK